MESAQLQNCSRHLDIERKYSYQCHLKRIHNIASREAMYPPIRKNSSNSSLLNQPGIESRQYSCYVLSRLHTTNASVSPPKPSKQKLIKLQQQNHRLRQRLCDISHRKKNNIFQQGESANIHKQVKTINMKSRNYQRKAKERSIQLQNQKFVDRIVEQKFRKSKSRSEKLNKKGSDEDMAAFFAGDKNKKAKYMARLSDRSQCVGMLKNRSLLQVITQKKQTNMINQQQKEESGGQCFNNVEKRPIQILPPIINKKNKK